MKRYIFYLALNLSILLTISCDAKKSNLNATHIGGCILRVPSVKPPSNLYSISKIIQTDEYQPFTKKLTVCGITLIGREDISDDFMKNVAVTIKEMFSPDGENIDKELQERLITNMYEYRTVIPLFKGENYEFSPSNEEKWDRTVLENSICDIIMEGVSGQVTEVVEHILHFVTAIGMHYTFPNEWGISRNSELYKAMNQAIDNGFYDITQYNEIDEEEDRLRVLLQEYAYWTIYTAWNLREPYGPKNAEWSIMTKAELIDKLPDSNMLFEKYVTKVFTAPSKTILESFVN